MAEKKTLCVEVFSACCTAVRNGVLIHRPSKRDKESNFRNWFSARLDGLHVNYDKPARNTYPDFRLVEATEGYEIKGLAYPGREADDDANIQVPTGYHNGRDIYYVFGRYPKDAAVDHYPVIDLVICHGDFLNADHEYAHENKNVKGFGSYGDIMIRDRKIYVAPTPFALTSGTTGQQTLILPASGSVDDRLVNVGGLTRVATEKLVVGYTFDLKKNTIKAELVDNPGKGSKREFTAYRLKGAQEEPVTIKEAEVEAPEDEDADAD